MPDISMCENQDCPFNTSCYRFTAEANPYRQSYGDFKPTVEDDELTCKYYLEIPKDKKTNFVDIFEVVKKKNYSELEEIKASLRVHLKKSKCKVNKLMLEKWIIEIEDLQGIKY